MPVTVTVGVNSYVSVADADAYFNERLFCTAWTGASEDDKARALIMAAKAIDRQLLKGSKKDTDDNQPLAFPRCYTVDTRIATSLNYIGNKDLVWDSDLWCEEEVPQAVKDAQCEEAMALLDIGNSSRLKLIRQGVTSISIGKTSESYNRIVSHGKGIGQGLLSQEARELLKPYLAGSAVIM